MLPNTWAQPWPVTEVSFMKSTSHTSWLRRRSAILHVGPCDNTCWNCSTQALVVRPLVLNGSESWTGRTEAAPRRHGDEDAVVQCQSQTAWMNRTRNDTIRRGFGRTPFQLQMRESRQWCNGPARNSLIILSLQGEWKSDRSWKTQANLDGHNT